MAPTKLTLRFRFTSDWGVGTGAGRHGSLDRVVVTDALGLPMLPAKPITGVLRDGAEQAAFGLSNGQGGVWQRWVDWLFGSSPATGGRSVAPPQPAQLRIRPGYLTELQAAVRRAPQVDPMDSGRRESLTRAELANAATVVRPGVRLDRVSGVAADDTLRMEQYARAGLTVVAQAGAPAQLPPEAALLLLLTAKLVTSVGGKRRRGPGACELLITGLPAVSRELAEQLIAQPQEPPQKLRGPLTDPTLPAAVGPGAPQPPAPRAPAADQLGMRLQGTLDLTCRTPVAIGAATVSNTVRSLDYIPGANLLPLLSAELDSVPELVRAGRLVVTNAYIVRAGQRCLPMPRALQAPKRATADTPLVNTLLGGAGRVMSVAGYLCPGGAQDLPSVQEVGMAESAHAVIDDAPQRPTAGTGGLFVQQAIPAGSVLRAEIWSDVDLRTQLGELPEHAAVGRSRKDDYGHVSVSFQAEPDGQPVATQPCGCLPDGELRVWLTADVLLETHARPDPSPQALADQIGARLNRTLTVSSAANVGWRRHETWSAAWGLPRPSLVALAAGSVLVLTGANCDDEQGCPGPALKELTATGIGLRRAEGFGRLCFNPAALATEQLSRRAAEPADVAPPHARPAGKAKIPALIANQAWRAIIDDAARAYAADPGKRREVIPPGATKAQLGVLRSIVTAMAADPLPGPEGGEQLGAARGQAWLATLTATDDQRNPTRAQKWKVSGEVVIGQWLGLDPTPAGIEKHRDRLSAALGVSPQVLRDRPAVAAHARTALLLQCITAGTRALQASEMSSPEVPR